MKTTCYLFLLFTIFCSQLFAQPENTISLNGKWDIAFDPNNEGKINKWYYATNFEDQLIRSIDVPSAWELIKQDYEGVAFYKKEFLVPEEWKEKIIRIQFGAVNYLSEVWLNDEVVGFHEGGFTPFEFRVDEMAKPGEINMLTLRVVGPITLTDQNIDGIGPMETPQWRGGITGGIWQPVRLVATGDIYVEDVYIKTNIHKNKATLELELNHTGIDGTEANVAINIYEAQDQGPKVASKSESISLRPGKSKHTWSLTINEAKYWSPDQPHLYRAEVIVENQEVISDRWSERFGFRELTIKNKDFYLNGKPIYIKASFFEGVYPNGIAYPDNEEMARREIRLAKEAGFNMIRPWRRPPAPMWLDLADEMGVLVVGSPALECMTLPVSTPYLPKRVENEIREAVLRDRNRACVVQWELFNELHRPVLKQLMRPMAMLVRTLDPTRLILDESGGWAFGANMYLPHEYEPTKFNDIHNYPGPFINKERYDGYLSIGMTEEEKKAQGYTAPTPGRNVVPGLMSYVSELGYGSLPDLTINNLRFAKDGNPLTPAYRYHHRLAKQQEEVLIESGFKYLYPDMQQFYLDQQHIHGTANKRMIEAVRANPEVDGYCIHALSAGDWILGAGLIDLWRNPKSYAYEATKAANQPRLLSIRTNPRNIYAKQGMDLEILGINEFEKVQGILHFAILDSKGKVVYDDKLQTNFNNGVSALIKKHIDTKRWNGKYQIEVKLVLDDGSIVAENDYSIDVFREKTLRVKPTEVAVLYLDNKLTDYLKERGVTVSPFDKSNSSIPLLVTNAPDGKTPDNKIIKQIFDFTRAGGTVLFAEGLKNSIENDDSGYPFKVNVYPARGLWTCIPHLVRTHEMFNGLPVEDVMRNEYENVWPRKTLRDLEGPSVKLNQAIVASIGFIWFSRGHKLHYSGPGDSWWGADVADLSIGKGRCIISQLQLVNNLGKDPVADKILANMINYLSKK